MLAGAAVSASYHPFSLLLAGAAVSPFLIAGYSLLLYDACSGFTFKRQTKSTTPSIPCSSKVAALDSLWSTTQHWIHHAY